jgi:hypothetical protein
VVLGFELSPALVRQVVYHLSHSPSPFCFIFQIESCVFAQASLRLQSSVSYVSEITGVILSYPFIIDLKYYHTWVICWHGILLTFCWGWPPNLYLPRSWDYRCEGHTWPSFVALTQMFMWLIHCISFLLKLKFMRPRMITALAPIFSIISSMVLAICVCAPCLFTKWMNE